MYMDVYRPCTARVKPSTYRGKVRVRLRVPSLYAREIASLGATCVDEPALLTVPVQVHVIMRAGVGFCAVRAHERFGQCASAVSLCRTARGQDHAIMRLRALSRVCELVPTGSYTRISTSVRSSTPQGFLLLCTPVQCEPPRASYSVLVLAPQGFVLLFTSVWCEPKRALCGSTLQRPCACVYCTSPKSYVRHESTKALYSVRQGLCFCVLYEPQELCAVRAYKGFVLLCTVRAPRALCGASPQRLYTVCARAGASVYCTSPKSFVRCEPTKALYSVRPGLYFCELYEPQELCAVRAYKFFVLLCTVRAPRALCGASPQRLNTVCARAGASVYCTSPKSFVRCEPIKKFIQCAPGLVLMYTVRAPRGLCGASLQRLYIVCWRSPPRLCTEYLCARAVV